MDETIERETFYTDFLFVGAGPACLCGAIRLRNMVDDHNPKEIQQQYDSSQGREISVNLLTTLDTHHYLEVGGGPLEALHLLSGDKPPPFCAYFASSPPAPLCVIAYNRQGESRRLLVTTRKFGGNCNYCCAGTDKRTGKQTCALQMISYVEQFFHVTF